MSIIYLVVGMRGEYDSYFEWNCKAFLTKERAYDFIDELKIELMEVFLKIKLNTRLSYEDACDKNYFKYLDPVFSYGRNVDDASFKVEEIELIDD